MMVYVKIPKKSTKKKDLGNNTDFNEVSGYKMNMQKSITVLCISNEQLKIKSLCFTSNLS